MQLTAMDEDEEGDEEEREDGSDRDSDENDVNAEKIRFDDSVNDGGHEDFFDIEGIDIEIREAMGPVTHDACPMQSEIQLTGTWKLKFYPC